MRALTRTAIVALALLLILASWTGLAALVREGKIVQIKPGMHRSDVDRLLGNGQPDIMSPACETCPAERVQMFYQGNPSLWYGRLEDNLVVCFVDDIVCDTTRTGL